MKLESDKQHADIVSKVKKNWENLHKYYFLWNAARIYILTNQIGEYECCSSIRFSGMRCGQELNPTALLHGLFF